MCDESTKEVYRTTHGCVPDTACQANETPTEIRPPKAISRGPGNEARDQGQHSQITVFTVAFGSTEMGQLMCWQICVFETCSSATEV